MTVDDLLERVATALDAVGIPYMLTGSMASTIHGKGRATYDVDLVIDPTAAQLRRFIASLPSSQYYVNLATALDALGRRSQFNVVDLESSWKADLIIRKDRPFSRAEFDRRREADYRGRRIMIASPEDVALAKLEWAKAGGSPRQIEDAAGILDAHPDFDRAYVEHWVSELAIENEWRNAMSAAGLT